MADPRPGLLHLDSSAGPAAESLTRRLTRLFADIWCDRHGIDGYRHRDLAADPVPPLGPAYVVLGRRLERCGVVPPEEVGALTGTPDERREWALTLPLIRELRAAGTVLLGVPMYNFSVPAALKAWIDRVTFPGAFLDPGTGGSALHDTRVVVVMARGGAYGPGTPREAFDFQRPYLRAWFRDHGVAEENLHFVQAEMALASLVPHLARFRDLADTSLAEARKELTELATRPPAVITRVRA
ncbi:FMN-dependent NADH-azoreductase [Streptomyces sp. Y2F8-2]|uniref:FMN-dependent NADH-azoreductase n=1 Tax=Streptomyces sp. Y2F8-2 TaxID=2759675 RepID=UPI001906C050|nr:NAD(P)H-dependent oxidoreductase [Streptomyces sp. Y2F8-2]GHK05253.1 FMN-dependent NADH-azoreductase [Streptomyces sp. Y2F8-2]